MSYALIKIKIEKKKSLKIIIIEGYSEGGRSPILAIFQPPLLANPTPNGQRRQKKKRKKKLKIWPIGQKVVIESPIEKPQAVAKTTPNQKWVACRQAYKYYPQPLTLKPLSSRFGQILKNYFALVWKKNPPTTLTSG